MDLSILIGFASGLALLALTTALAHVPPETLLHPEALLIVFAGTLTATLAGSGVEAIRRAWRALFSKPAVEGGLDPREVIAQVMDVAAFIRSEGILALQPIIDGVDLPFFRKGLRLLMDNRSEKFIRDSLLTEMEILHRQGLDDARVFEMAGGYAPTMGVIGAVIGLVCVLQEVGSGGPLGRGVASAFIATLYGVALANLFLLPAATRLRARARDEWRIRTLVIEAIAGIHAGEHPLLLEERLAAFYGGTTHSDPLLPKDLSREISDASSAFEPDSAHSGVLPPRAVMEADFLQARPLVSGPYADA